MKIILSIFAVLMCLLWSPSPLYALSDGNYYLEDRNPSNPDIDEKHVGHLSTATPSDQFKEKKITKYYKRMGVLEDNIWQNWLGKNYSEIYIIQKGDTLWDISDKFLDSPWYWPKIWEMNNYITNPHWIYPGNELKFTYSGTTGPSVTVIRKKGVDYSILERDKVPSLFENPALAILFPPTAGVSVLFIRAVRYVWEKNRSFQGLLNHPARARTCS